MWVGLGRSRELCHRLQAYPAPFFQGAAEGVALPQFIYLPTGMAAARPAHPQAWPHAEHLCFCTCAPVRPHHLRCPRPLPMSTPLRAWPSVVSPRASLDSVGRSRQPHVCFRFLCVSYSLSLQAESPSLSIVFPQK